METRSPFVLVISAGTRALWKCHKVSIFICCNRWLRTRASILLPDQGPRNLIITDGAPSGPFYPAAFLYSLLEQSYFSDVHSLWLAQIQTTKHRLRDRCDEPIQHMAQYSSFLGETIISLILQFSEHFLPVENTNYGRIFNAWFSYFAPVQISPVEVNLSHIKSICRIKQ